MVHRVVVNEGSVPAAARAVPFSQHADDFVKLTAPEVPVGPRAAQQREQTLLVPFARRDFRHDLLRQYVERLGRHDEPVELAAAHRHEYRRALQKIIARQREQTPPGRAAEGVPGAPDALQECGDGARRGDLTDELNLADVDTELQ